MARSRPARILVVEDDKALNEVMRDELTARGYDVVSAETVAAALDALKKTDLDLAILDLMLPDGSGLEVLKRIVDEALPTEAIVLTGYATISSAIEAMKLGAYDYLTKPTRTEELELLVAKAVEKARLRRENEVLRVQVGRLTPVEGIVTQDSGMREMLEMVARVAPSDIPVLIQGETGTGKELVARAVHHQSPRAAQAFVALNCSSVSESLVESELFGHEKGAFTGAVERKPGLFEVADRGTLFLDEVGDVAASVQVKLLRAIESGEFLRVGGVRSVHADVRIVSASHKVLRTEAMGGQYREDLFHRLNGVTIQLPPLRERKGDIPLLSAHFLERYSSGKKHLTKRSVEILESYSWPGNVRELQMVIRRAALLSDGEAIDVKHLLLDLWDPRRKGTFKGLTLAEVEEQYIMQVLDEQRGHRSKAARVLGIDPKTLYNKLKGQDAGAPSPEEDDEDEAKG